MLTPWSRRAGQRVPPGPRMAKSTLSKASTSNPPTRWPSTNKMTLHSDPACIINGKDCQGSQGCSIDSGPYGSGPYGSGINSAGGATYALEWTSSGMSIWGWTSNTAPSDALGNAPDPSGWGTPTASFPSSSSCNTDTYFRNQQIVFDTTFCGTSKADPHRLFSVLLTGTRAGVWAGTVWASDPQCSSLASTCQEYVQNNPKAFADAYWSINALKIYTNSDGSTSSGPTSGSTSGSMGNTDTTDTIETESSSRRVGGGGVATIANHQPPSTINPQASTPTTNPTADGRTGGGRTWGSGRGDRGGRGGRGGGRKEKPRLRVRGQHVWHICYRNRW